MTATALHIADFAVLKSRGMGLCFKCHCHCKVQHLHSLVLGCICDILGAGEALQREMESA